MTSSSKVTMLHFPNYILSQELNNHAASLIEKGSYDEAISSLAKAMKLSRDCVCSPAIDDDDDDSGCSSCCNSCSLEACVRYSTERTMERAAEEDTTKNESQQQQQQQQHTGYLHRQPIMIQPSCLQFGHSLGSILPLMLTFNLALAHHFKALSSIKNDDDANAATSEEATRHKNMVKACKLYELSYRVHEEQLDCEDESIWFVMMVANNLGQAHQTLNHEKEHTECMETLMSTIMFFIDCGAVDNDTDNEPSSSSLLLVDTSDFEGFVGNASTLLLPCVCAEAA